MTDPVAMTEERQHAAEELPTGNFVFFATPTLDHKPCADYQASMFGTSVLLAKNNYDNVVRFLGGDPYLSKARNYLATEFLRSTATHLFFIDDDLRWPPEAALRLLQHDKDVIAGVYPKKSDKIQFPCELLLDDKNDLIVEDGLVQAAAVPTGFLCIKRHVIEKVCEKSGWYHDINGVRAENIFQMGFNLEDPETGRGSWWGEDYAWCNTWRLMGGKIWVDPNIEFGHRGYKTWVGNYNDAVQQWLEKKREDDAAKAAPGEVVPEASAAA